MAQSITSYGFQLSALTALTAAAATFDLPNVRLTKTLVADGLENPLTAYTGVEADYSGYVLDTPSWGIAGIYPDGFVRVATDLNYFVPNATTTANTIFNAFVNATGGSDLLLYATLPDPVTLADPEHLLLFTAMLPWYPQAPQLGLSLSMSTPNPIRRAALALLTGGSAILHNAKAHLTQARFAITPETPLSTLAAMEADYDGYVAQTIAAWLAPVIPSNGSAEVSGSLLRWAPTGSVTANTIYGVYVTNAASDTLYFSYLLDQPQAMQGTDTGFYDSPTLMWGT